MVASERTQEILKQYSTSLKGLAAEEAAERLKRWGPNEPVSSKPQSIALRFLGFFATPLSIILLLAALISGILGDVTNASVITTIIVLGATVDFVQTLRSQNATRRLQDSVAPTASVYRDGTVRELPRRELVPGDVVDLIAGDLVPADARLIDSRDLHVNEAALTGESLPVEKESSGTEPELNSIWLGTSVVSGHATAVVAATGAKTRFGDIAVRLSARQPETEFERGTRRFGFLIMQTVVALILFIAMVGVAFRKDPFESLLFAIALAVGLTPEFLPVIITVTLAQGAIKMSRSQVVVKNLSAIQNFGSMDVLCSDKTGTLTSGRMSVEDHLDADGQSSSRVFLFAYLNSIHESGVADPMGAAVIHRQNVNPLDLAILAHEHPDVGQYRKLDEIPFDFERRCISVVVGKDGTRLLITKGAPEGVLARCVGVEKHRAVEIMDASARQSLMGQYESLAARGLRVLAVATRLVPDQPAYRVADERELVFAGFVTFADPPLADVASTLENMRADGVRVKIITGDSAAVARHVCGEVGLQVDRIVDGEQLDTISESALVRVADSTEVFARVSPSQKNRIILALKRGGHVVGYLGDGINDAPSLRAADVGVTVSNAVDVAKDAADIVLMQHSLSVLHSGIVEGRRAFGNVMKYLLMGTSSNFGNMFSMAGAFLVLPFLPMLPSQILVNNFLYDLSQVTIPGDHVDASFTRKPRKWDIYSIRRFMLIAGPVSSLFDFLTFGVLLWVMRANEALFHTGWFVESLATQTLVLLVIRTQGNPFRSRPSTTLLVTVLAIVALGAWLPYSQLGAVLGFTPLPGLYFVFLLPATIAYLLIVQLVKRKAIGQVLG